ncbi:hypothetical protein NOK64_26755 [Vibrio parahaemolyticus]|uniref:hypothetical protein n=1 Tax=Vibrio parahaemolyticus TaxID=670 RepID=UPI002269CFB1|nr:hypothetical protein [Vibrio parahaemolyticus]MCX8759409.1 hypothetical protein [Vibrio parahaemolyticus]
MISKVKNQTYKELYASLDTKEGKNRIYKLAKSRERKSRDISQVMCIKDENDRVLVKENEIKDRWYKYFYKLFNDSNVQHSHRQENLESNTNDLNYSYFRRITNLEVKDALRKMKCGKAIGPDGLPIEVWKCIGEVGIKWLTKFFNIILKTKKIPDEWRKSSLVPIFKNKGGIQNYNNYRGIKLMSHTMKLWEGIIEQRLRHVTTIRENQFGFMLGRSIIEVIHLLRKLIEHFRVADKTFIWFLLI